MELQLNLQNSGDENLFTEPSDNQPMLMSNISSNWTNIKLSQIPKHSHNNLLDDDCSEFFNIEIIPTKDLRDRCPIEHMETVSTIISKERTCEVTDGKISHCITVDQVNISDIENLFNDTNTSFEENKNQINSSQSLKNEQIPNKEFEQHFGNSVAEYLITAEEDFWSTPAAKNEKSIKEVENEIQIDVDNITQQFDIIDLELSIAEIKNMISSQNQSAIRLSNKLSFNNTLSHSGILNISPVTLSSSFHIHENNIPSAIDPNELKQKLEPTLNSRDLKHWGLPEKILDEYETKGVTNMFEWQAECLSNRKVLFESKNLVYSAPTSAGKTLVSELLMIKTIIERRKKAILILPFISVVREKMFYLQDLLRPFNLRVEGFFGGYSPPGGFDKMNMAICTIEKANSIVNRLLETDNLSDIGIIVLDEIHLLSDPSRGYILELLLAKILYICRKRSLRIQIITMSATLPNSELLVQWLDAEHYLTTFRPVELHEMIKIGDTIYETNGTKIRTLDNNKFNEIQMSDQDHITQLTIETITDGHSVLIFCPSKDWCERLGMTIAETIYKLGKTSTDVGKMLRELIKLDDIDDMKNQLKKMPVGLDSTLEKTITYGVAFHHAGLTTDERDIIENSFKCGILKVIIATSTLSSGVNLPARRVIIRTPMFGGKTMNSLTYRQMIGRAGRTGKDTLGESILICTESNAMNGKQLIRDNLTPISSSLNITQGHLERAILEIIASGVAKTKQDLQLFIECTLLWTEKQEYFLNESNDPISKCLKFLIEYEFIRLQMDEDTNEMYYISTMLGNACLSSSLPPMDGMLLFCELQKSRQCFVLENELHAVYLVTPYSVCYQLQDLDWMIYLDLWEKSSNAMKRVGELAGIKESFLVKSMRGVKALDQKIFHIHKRFYIALALYELINDIPISLVANKYKLSRGLLQSLQQMSSTFAGIVTTFCQSLNWDMLSLIISQFKNRLFFGVSQDLIDLLRIPNLTSVCARSLYNHGIKCLVDLANADLLTVENILSNSISFESVKKQQGEDEYEANQRNAMRNFCVTGKPGMTIRNAAKSLISNAQIYLEIEMGIENAQWKTNKKSLNSNNISLCRNTPKNTTIEMDVSKTFENLNISKYTEQSCSQIMLSVPSQQNYTTLSIVSIGENIDLFKNFLINNTEEIGFSIAVGHSEVICEQIGDHLLKDKPDKTKQNKFRYNDGMYMAGISFHVDTQTIYYLDLQEDNIIFPTERKLELLRNIFRNQQIKLIAVDAKEQLFILIKSMGLISANEIKCEILDPYIADWLVRGYSSTNGYIKLVEKYLPDHFNRNITLLKEDNKSKFYSAGLNHRSKIPPKIRSSEESFLNSHIMTSLKNKLKNVGHTCLYKHLLNVEMPIQLSLLSMELNGFAVDYNKAEFLYHQLNNILKKLEIEIYKIHGKKFNINSSSHVAKVLGIKTKPSEKPSVPKEVLEQINSPLSNLISLYRKISATITKNVHPLMVNVINNRIYSKNICLTTTGRISMHEPNLQNVARDFNVEFNGCNLTTISCRQIFETVAGRKLISADFCQLELRILTHLSHDSNLMKIMNSEDDVFKMVAAKWNYVKIDEVTEAMRHNTKQICYAIIYGMGKKSLGHTLDCDENTVTTFLEQFHNTFPTIRKYTDSVITRAKECGYVETMSGRRRYFANINNEDSTLRAQSERKAVNTTVQGSASDILKLAILRMDRNLKKYEKQFTINLPENKNSSVDLVLHLHDELIYEVPANRARQVAKILKMSMENCVRLSIPLRAKVKIGDNWGALKEIQI